MSTQLKPFRGRPTYVNWNFWLGVYNGIFVNGAEAFFHSSLVLAPFLAALGAPPVLIGLIPALRVGGWFLPQLLVASRLAHEPFKMPWYRRMSLIRFISYVIMVSSVFLVSNYTVLMVIVLTMIAINAVSSGVTGVPFAEITAKVVPHYRLGTFWALRNAIGGGLALLSGLVLRKVLASDLAFPHNFGVLFLLGTILISIAYLSFCLVREPEGKPHIKEPFRAMIKKIPPTLRSNASFRRYLRVRFLALLALLADPFYAVYALQNLNAPASMLGVFVIMATVASITANFLFRKPANKAHNVTILQVSIGLLILAPLMALLLPSWHAFGIVFMFSAAGQSGVGIAAWNLLYAIAPEEERPMYVGTANSLLSLPSLAPIMAGFLVGLLGYQLTFLLAFAAAVTALSFSFRFKEMRKLDALALGKHL